MIERHEDLWLYFGHPGHRVGISTNGFVKKNGEAVMGRGCAKQATELFRGIALLFGDWLKRNGNVPGYLIINKEAQDPAVDRLMILPVKHNWWEMADIGLVTTSILFLNKEAQQQGDWTFHVPRLGCGNGRLDWASVRERMEPLPDNVVVHY